ncbi:MAG: hypothetical protein IH867_09290 [Chloroflexi bacterium]|nr:hypothetical protein [Chloroflexota bacterium]
MLEAQSLENFVISELKSVGLEPDVQRAKEHQVDLLATDQSKKHIFIVDVKSRRLSFSDVARFLAINPNLGGSSVHILALSESALESTPQSVATYAAQNGISVISTSEVANFVRSEDWFSK